jgi:hypothetical protein
VNGEDGYSKYFTLLDALAIPYVALKDNDWGDAVRYSTHSVWMKVLLGMLYEGFLVNLVGQKGRTVAK